MTRPPCYYHGRDNLDLIVTFSINGDIYDYYLRNISQVEACDYSAKRFQLKGFNYAKKHAWRVVLRELTHA